MKHPKEEFFNLVAIITHATDVVGIGLAHQRPAGRYDFQLRD